ncbi:MAG: hypothetical protein PHG23_02585 [Candidatus Pacebacteria bacterium]|nr:hypothetical protein [Candidatus Paceibacterota bacterium]
MKVLIKVNWLGDSRDNELVRKLRGSDFRFKENGNSLLVELSDHPAEDSTEDRRIFTVPSDALINRTYSPVLKCEEFLHEPFVDRAVVMACGIIGGSAPGWGATVVCSLTTGQKLKCSDQNGYGDATFLVEKGAAVIDACTDRSVCIYEYSLSSGYQKVILDRKKVFDGTIDNLVDSPYHQYRKAAAAALAKAWRGLPNEIFYAVRSASPPAQSFVGIMSEKAPC